MARKVTLAELRTQVRQRADQVNSGFIKDPELDTYINGSAAELYDILVGAYGEDYFATIGQITTVSNEEFYDVPDDFYKLIGLDLVLQAGSTASTDKLTLKRYEFNKRNYYGRTGQFILTADENIRYRIRGDQLSLIPVPRSQRLIELIYIPAIPKLEVSSDELDGVNGWEEYVVIDAAIKCLIKEESNIAPLTYQKEQMMARIEKMASDRDIGMGDAVTDINRVNNLYYSEGQNY